MRRPRRNSKPETSRASAMPMPASPAIVRLFLHVIRARVPILTVFIALTALGIAGAVRIRDDPSIERLVVPGDPAARATAEFHRIFPEGQPAVIELESADPLSLTALRAADTLEQRLSAIPHVE